MKIGDNVGGNGCGDRSGNIDYDDDDDHVKDGDDGHVEDEHLQPLCIRGHKPRCQ